MHTKAVSDAVRAANQADAQLFTGPRTEKGKSTTRDNALRHGNSARKTRLDTHAERNEISPKELHMRLLRREQQLSENAFKWLHKEFTNHRYFSYPLFDPPGANDESRKLLSDPGVRYDFLLQRLRNCRSREVRLRMLATWLRLEGVCRPEDLLGDEFSRYRARALRGTRGSLALTDLRQAFIIDNWTLYFEQLLLARRNRLNLRQLGFEGGAIQAADKKRSAVAAHANT